MVKDVPQDISLDAPSRAHGEARARRLSRIFVPIIAVALIVVAVVNVLVGLNRPSIPDEIEGLIVYNDLSDGVTNGQVSYDITPPAGGLHAATSLECGIYFNPIPNEQAVAALATGAVWVAYDPELTEIQVDDLKLFAEGELDVFMSPYVGLPNPIVITAWGRQLYADSPTDPRIASFLRDFTNGEQAPAPDALCLDGEPAP
jgi:hypothetical protein